MKQPLIFIRFFQSEDLQNTTASALMFLEGSRAFSLGPHGSFGCCPELLWMLGTIQERSRDVLAPQNKSPRLKMEALGGRSPACSCIKSAFLTFFRNLIERSPRRSRALWNAAYGSPRSSDSSPGGVWGRWWEPRGSVERSQGVAGCHLTSLTRSKGYLVIINRTLLF